MNAEQLGYLVLGVATTAAATVALCLGHITSDVWLGVVGPSGVLAAVGNRLGGNGSSSSSPATPQPIVVQVSPTSSSAAPAPAPEPVAPPGTPGT